MNSASGAGITTNPHALDAIVKASATHTIVASQDIVDVRGVKLWARGQPISAELQQRLLERKLQHPMEACLQTEGGATLFTLVDDLRSLLESDNPLASVLKPWSSLLVDQAKQLPLHAVAQLLLTAAMATRPNSMPHAVMGMALSGAMVASRNLPLAEIRLAMLGGLLHDIGEVYIQPQYLDYATALDTLGHKHLMVHPRVAEMLLNTTTDYPKTLTRGIGEHHERLDRSGYPARLNSDQISTLGRVLMVMEVALGILRAPKAPLTRISFALRVVPGEFDPAWTGFLCDAARRAREIPPVDAAGTPRDAGPLERLDAQLAETRELAVALQRQRGSAAVMHIVEEAMTRLDRLRVAWNALGLWGLPQTELRSSEQFELALAGSELEQRLRGLQRECLLLSENLGDTEKLQLSPLWAGLQLNAPSGTAPPPTPPVA
ncbi:MAG: HD domain-containing phosphohydrolase [Pseudomonadota bacterium]